ncbi:peptidase M19 renal dipeptidase [Parvibaculum lavamentivorans DS-1]|uniref:Peptidase M19 renal dipeptidase n=1 Tax=Parvibaculum lavamentivorans (strain DS-1 / DSM 13023 / NCIMB 13966) TaxID=402881 RepID=A7HVX3_PARL1|nr:dipeptidase [Parvibaculum lavamentivorans]ABS64056.1 peptidase M19 renal dipeptidase [Parvibaculum lavamentivorans DS-1]
MKRILIGLGLVIAILLVTGLALLPGILEDRINRIVEHEPYEIAPDAAARHGQLAVVDLHADTLLWARDPLDRASRGHVDLPRLVDGNVALQVFSVVTKVPRDQRYVGTSGDSDIITLLAMVQRWPARTWDSLLERALYQAEKLHRAEEAAPGELRIVRTAADIDALLAARGGGSRPVGGLLATEGSHALEGKLENIQRLYDAGYRMMGLTHFFDNELGGSLHGISGGGLTDFGREAVLEMERLNIIVDLAHASPAVVADTLDIATRPTVVSHTGIKGACDSPRNLDDALMKRIAGAGGLVGIGYWAGAICDPAPAEVVKSIRYAIDFLGVDHVALGSDYDGAVPVAFDTSQLAVLTDEMQKAGFTDEEIAKIMGGNAIRFLREQLPAD